MLQRCTRLLHLWFRIFKPFFRTEQEERDAHKVDRKTVWSFDISLHWHQILLSCFSLKSSAEEDPSIDPTAEMVHCAW